MQLFEQPHKRVQRARVAFIVGGTASLGNALFELGHFQVQCGRQPVGKFRLDAVAGCKTIAAPQLPAAIPGPVIELRPRDAMCGADLVNGQLVGAIVLLDSVPAGAGFARLSARRGP